MEKQDTQSVSGLEKLKQLQKKIGLDGFMLMINVVGFIAYMKPTIGISKEPISL